MKYFFTSAVKKRLERSSGLILMFDFDGVLSPIAETPDKAILPEAVKQKIKECAKFFPTAIISGRKLLDIKRKVGINKIVFAGSHGFEWQIGNKNYKAKLPVKVKRALVKAERGISLVLKKYPGTILEKKYSSLSVHYRKLKEIDEKYFIGKINKEMRKYSGGGLSLLKGKKVLELRCAGINKGNFAQAFIKHNENLTPVYVGDDNTDEDVFKALKNGITIRVGKKKASFAMYYIKSQEEIDELLKYFLSLV